LGFGIEFGLGFGIEFGLGFGIEFGSTRTLTLNRARRSTIASFCAPS